MSWQGAHGGAMIAAAHAHEDLGVVRDGYVDVFAAINAGGLLVMGQPNGELFGAYFGPESNGPGVLVNSDFNETVVRHTAAHELGHHALGHGTKTDKRIEAFEEWGKQHWPEPEKAAEAFAAWFLMPRGAVLWALGAIGRARVESPADAYQISLWLGTSFRGTVRHLTHLKMITARQAEEWSKPGPGLSRRALDGGSAQRSVRHWDLGPTADGRELHVCAGDRFTIRGLHDRGQSTDLPDGVSPGADRAGDPRTGGEVVLEVGPALLGSTLLTLSKNWEITLIPAPDRQGLITTRTC